MFHHKLRTDWPTINYCSHGTHPQLQCSRFSIEYLLLPPRSAHVTAPDYFTAISFDAITLPSYSLSVPVRHASEVEYKYNAIAPSIFGASCFGRWVVTHSLADSDFMATVLLSSATNTLYRSHAHSSFRHFNSTFGSTHSASSAYQKLPTKHTYLAVILQSRKNTHTH